ncbi:FkbM family methyltransferase [Bradyrhizobium sp.]|uniref:FkbM family methyltransferase n=1 Tax=Bradyrhizobium sp. TaxID=376 RepID=UPI001EC1BFEC|nr:FkbM family methyltransferase [Bradyrhizobium sp.]MBV9985223.1 FkbM family methyltransferase [Bradyrhizobium sp.]
MIQAAKAFLRQGAPGLYNVARFLRLQGERALFREYTATHLFGRQELSVIIADRVGKEWYDRDMVRPSSFDFFDALRLSKGARAFVLGAHQAVVGMMLARDVGTDGSIVAVEGNYANYIVGKRNIELNRLKNMTLLHAVVGSADGQLYFSRAHNGMVEPTKLGPAAQQVRSVSIDSLAAEYGSPDIVMLDIEGYEAHALEGAPITLRSRCVWYVEVHGNTQLGRYGRSNSDVTAFFSQGFDLFFSPDDISEFVPLNDLSAAPEQRFFLIAVPKATTS